jgi:hypothetical protein
MNQKVILLVCVLIVNILTLNINRAVASVGGSKCEPYTPSDTRKQPKTSIISASLQTKGSGYILALDGWNIELDSKLNFISTRRSQYANDPMKISRNGKFSITIFGNTNICTYSGTAKISPKAYSRLFENSNRSR